MVITRFAPSPSGNLHIGNARIAITSWLFTRKKKGKFILRIDDTKKYQNNIKYIENIKRDLDWLGIKWDITFRQSHRIHRYHEVATELIKSKRIYPCFETKEELLLEKKKQINAGKPPIYNRDSLLLNDKNIIKLKSQGKTPHWRFYLKNQTIQWTDHIKGKIIFEGSKLSDPIVIRNDGSFTYYLASVIDDIDYQITDIIRGEDHITNSAIQIQIFEALNKTTPNFAHIPLITNKGKKLSKKEGGYSIESIRREKISPEVILYYLSGMKQKAINKNITIKSLKLFCLDNIGKSNIEYNTQIVLQLNSKYIKSITFDQVKEYLNKQNKKNYLSQSIWETIKDNIDNINDVVIWNDIFDNSFVSKNNYDDYLIKTFLDLRVTNNIDKWLNNIKKTIPRCKFPIQNLRLVLTGKRNGPNILEIMYALGENKIITRLKYQLQ